MKKACCRFQGYKCELNEVSVFIELTFLTGYISNKQEPINM